MEQIIDNKDTIDKYVTFISKVNRKKPIKHFRIKQDKHGNSTIKPAKLEGGKLVVA